MRIALVTDSHLAPAAEAFNANWDAVRNYVGRAGADLTIHLGDITLDAWSDPGQHDFARAASRDWPTQLLFLPGNHDIGDNPPGPHTPSKHPLDLDRLAEYRASFGADYWVRSADGWWLIGLNAQLFGTGTAAEAEQWTWLGARIGEAAGRPLALLLHKPLFWRDPAEDVPHIRYVPRAQRQRLLDLLAALDLRLVLSGHTHQHVDHMIRGVRHIWLPSSAFLFPDAMQERIGEKITGLGMLELTGDAHRFDLVCPEGVMPHNLLDHPVYAGMAVAHSSR